MRFEPVSLLTARLVLRPSAPGDEAALVAALRDGTIAGAGFTRVALLAEQPGGRPAATPTTPARPAAPPARPAGQPRG